MPSEPIGRWSVTVGPDERHLWEPDLMTLAEVMTIESLTGLSFKGWVNAIDDRRTSALQALVWLLRRKAGREQNIEDVDFVYREFDVDRVPDPEAEAVSTG